MRNDNPLLNKPLELETADVTKLDVYSNTTHLRRDIHAFVAYVSERDVKRAHRSNDLPKADARRLAKLMSYPNCLQDIQEDGYSWWVNAVDSLAYDLGFVRYDTKGTYMGYSSHSPSFPDNYIEFKEQKYNDFLAHSLLEQETLLLKAVVNDKGYNEFYTRHLHSQLNGFPTWGSATKVMPLLKFPQTRRFLLKLLSKLESGQWYTTKSLSRYLKQNHPYFLIPKASDLPKEKGGWGKPPTDMERYGNFQEYKKGREYYHDNKPIPDDAVDGFERVEGRFIERFLEGIPLTLGYVDVAYSKKPYQGAWPERNMVQAFRVNGRFLQFMREESLSSKVTVLPNYEIHVESPFYDPGLMQQLQTLAELVTEDRVSVLKLDQQLVKATLATNPELNPVSILQRLTNQTLPQNIIIELEEWAGQADAFTLYEGFALLEGDKRLPEIRPYVVEEITPQLRLIRQPDKVFKALQQAERIPLTVRHGESRFTNLPTSARTIFPKAEKPKPKRKTKKRITLQRDTKLVLIAPTAVFYEKLRDELLKQRCIFEPNPATLTVTYSPTYKEQVDSALKVLREKYIIKFEDKPA